MSLPPIPIEPGPEETARVARAAFAAGNPYLTFRDELARSPRTTTVPRSFQLAANLACLRGALL